MNNGENYEIDYKQKLIENPFLYDIPNIDADRWKKQIDKFYQFGDIGGILKGFKENNGYCFFLEYSESLNNVSVQSNLKNKKFSINNLQDMIDNYFTGFAPLANSFIYDQKYIFIFKENEENFKFIQNNPSSINIKGTKFQVSICMVNSIFLKNEINNFQKYLNSKNLIKKNINFKKEMTNFNDYLKKYFFKIDLSSNFNFKFKNILSQSKLLN